MSARGVIIKRVPLYQQVREYLLDGIRSSKWKDGDMLPSENQLAEVLNVSRITIKQALSDLVSEGLVYRIQGKGTFLSARAEGEPALCGGQSPNTRDTSRPPFVAYLAPRLHNEYMTSLLICLEAELARYGHYVVFIRTYEDQEIEKERIKALEKTGVRGIIIFPVDGDIYNEEIVRLTLGGYPLVVIDRYLRGIETNCVCSDNISGAYQAVKHLLSLGHRSIAFISTRIRGTSSIEDRFVGYEQAFADCGVPVRPELYLTNLSVGNKTNKDTIRDFLAANPDITAVLAVNTTIGAEIIAAANMLKKTIPGDLSLVFFDKIERLPFEPTYIKQSPEKIAEEAVRILFENIEDPEKKRVKINLPPEFVAGESTGKMQAQTAG